MLTWEREQLFSVREAAAVLGVSTGRVYALASQRRLGCRKVGRAPDGTGGKLLLSRGDLDRYLSGEVPADRPPTAAQRKRQRREAAERVRRRLGLGD